MFLPWILHLRLCPLVFYRLDLAIWKTKTSDYFICSFFIIILLLSVLSDIDLLKHSPPEVRKERVFYLRVTLLEDTVPSFIDNSQCGNIPVSIPALLHSLTGLLLKFSIRRYLEHNCLDDPSSTSSVFGNPGLLLCLPWACPAREVLPAAYATSSIALRRYRPRPGCALPRRAYTVRNNNNL